MKKKREKPKKMITPMTRKPALWFSIGGLALVVVVSLGMWLFTHLGPVLVFQEISPVKANELIARHKGDSNFVILDVRTPEEYVQGYLPLDNKTPLNLDFRTAGFRDQLARLDREKAYLVYCRTGNRSGQAAELMRELGFRQVYDLKGGIVAWQDAGLPLTIEK